MGANIAANVFSLRAYKPLSVPRFLVLILEPYTHAVYLEPVSDVVDGFKNCFVGGGYGFRNFVSGTLGAQFLDLRTAWTICGC